MRVAIARLVRRLSGAGALDNVGEVLVARAAVDRELDALAVRLAAAPVREVVTAAAA